jgi:hypothetical protein
MAVDAQKQAEAEKNLVRQELPTLYSDVHFHQSRNRGYSPQLVFKEWALRQSSRDTSNERTFFFTVTDWSGTVMISPN